MEQVKKELERLRHNLMVQVQEVDKTLAMLGTQQKAKPSRKDKYKLKLKTK